MPQEITLQKTQPATFLSEDNPPKKQDLPVQQLFNELKETLQIEGNKTWGKPLPQQACIIDIENNILWTNQTSRNSCY
jgi:hypothetical protein